MELLLSALTPQVVDTVAILFVLFFALNGLSKGFTKLFFKVFGTLLSLLFAVLLCTSVTNFLQAEYSAVTLMSEKLEGALTNIFGANVMDTSLEQVSGEYLAELGIGNWLASIIMTFANDSAIPTNVTLNQVICPTFAYYVVMVLAVIGLFIIFKILIYLLGAFVKKLHSIRVVATIDRTLGLVLGLICGIIYLELLIMVIGVIPIPAAQSITSTISQAAFVSVIRKINLYKVIFDAISSINIVDYVKNIILI